MYLSQNGSDINFCRSLDYYVDPNSEEILELGTQQYPFKNINLVFIELFNVHSNQMRSINIFVKEKTDNYLMPESVMIKNTTSVSISSYSEYLPDDPAQTNFIVSDSQVSLTTSRTLFNIIQDTTLDTLSPVGMEEMEYGEILGTSSYVFLINRASVTFDNINLTCELSNSALALDFVYTSYCFGQTVSFTNMFIRMQGKVFQNSIATLNLFAENITMDTSYSIGGFLYASFCSFHGELNLSELTFNNIVAYTTRTNSLLYGLIINMGNANLTINNLDIEVYNVVQNNFIMIGIFVNPNCFPQDDVLQKSEIDGVVSKIPNNYFGDRISIIGNYAIIPSSRAYQFKLKNCDFSDTVNLARPYAGSHSLFNVDVLFENITVLNSTFGERGLMIKDPLIVTLKDLHFESITMNAGMAVLTVLSSIV